MENKYNWNLTDIFENTRKYEECKKDLNQILEQIKRFQGTLNCSKNIYDCYNLYEKALEKLEKIYAYGMLTYHLDMANQDSIKLFKEVEGIETNFSMVTAFIVPEITKMDDNELRKIINDPSLEKYKRIVKEILEEKEHILSESQEKLLANFGEVLNSSKNTYDILTNAEFKFGNLIDENGKTQELTDGTYSRFLRSKDKNVRIQAFDLMYNKYSEFINTITELYLTKVKAYTITSRIRNYSSSLERAVKHDDASLKVYEKLIESVNQNITVNHKYLELKKKMLDLDEMHFYDIYLNPFELEQDKISFEEAKKQVLEALSILGEEYTEKLKEAFENRWIDVYEKPNKRGGAYSIGVYGVHPYVLTNFIESKRDVSTIAHELGHSMHSYYSNKTQNIIDSNYTIMVAEVASTVNEILLASYQIQNEHDKTKKAEIIYELLEMIRATLFRQAMFAEFEKEVHEKIEQNQMLSSEDLCSIYYALNQKYFGKSPVIDEKIKYEWLRIPHFYSCFYVYKYATGISSAIAIASKILKGEPGFVEKYINMLKQGCSKKSIDLLKMVDVDLESTKPYEDAIQFYNEKIDELESLL